MEPPESSLPKALIALLKQQHYALFGNSAVKLCHWTKSALAKNKGCYKQKFYGIQSHRCIQMSPDVAYCDQKCTFCWRPLTSIAAKMKTYDKPDEIADESIRQQRALLSGYGSLIEQIGEKKLDEARNPRHVAISLAGEPTLYPKLSELIKAYHKRKLTTFLVTNGMHPEVLSGLELPTQLYVSLDAPNESLHKKINKPLLKDSWKRLNSTLELLPSLKTRKAVRITLVKGINIAEPEGYARLLEKAKPDFVELKAYMHVGFSRERLEKSNMPMHDEVKQFAESINKHLNYKLKDESKESRVVLLWNGSTKSTIKGIQED